MTDSDPTETSTPYCADRNPSTGYLCTLPVGHLDAQAKGWRFHRAVIASRVVGTWPATAQDLLSTEVRPNIVADLYDAITPLAAQLRMLFGPVSEGGTGNAGAERKVDHLRSAMMLRGDPTWFDLLGYLVACLGTQRPDDTKNLRADLLNISALALLWAKQLDES